MNYKRIFLGQVCSIIFIIAVCGATANGQVVDITGNPTTTTMYALGANLYAVNESIYTETEIGSANFTTPATSINQVSFNINTVGTNTTFTNVTIWMKEVPMGTTTFETGTYTTVGYTQVFSGSISAGTADWTPISLTVPFQRTNGNNFQLLVERSDGVLHTGYVYASASGNNTGNTAASSRRYNGATPLSATTSLSATAFRAQIRLEHTPPLPVTLLTFDVTRYGKTNRLNWSTSQELNTKRFVIERGTDGLKFAPIADIAASGNSNIIHSYNFSDDKPTQGINYYRLLVQDIDNSGRYSKVRSVRNKGSFDIAVYPNPARTIFNIKINADKTEKGELLITDISGKSLLTKAVDISKGLNLIPMDIRSLPAGTYLVKIILNNEIMISKFSKQQ